MYIKELSVEEFENFAKYHINSNFHQTVKYAKLKSEEGFEYELLGLINNEKIVAATLLLVNKVGNYLYAYCPEGFLINYHNEEIFNAFTRELIKYCKKENIIFVKVNPSVIKSEIDLKTKEKCYIENNDVLNLLQKNNYTHLKDNIYFESVLPRINVIKDIKGFSLSSISKEARNKMSKATRKGLVFEKVDNSNVDILDNFVKNKIQKDKFHYHDYLNTFSIDNSIDLFLVSANFNKYLINSQKLYDKELENNKSFNLKVSQNPNERNINKKLASDRNILLYKNDITYSSKHLNDEKLYLAGALCIKHNNKITILISGYDKKYKNFNANYFLYYSILDYYKDDYEFVDLNGITLDFNKDNKYFGLNNFKLAFKPHIYEYIGEYDLIINNHIYEKLLNNGILAKNFNKDL